MLLLAATMMAWTSACAQTSAENEAANAAIIDGGYYYVKTNGYYLKGDGTLTSSKQEATEFLFQKSPGIYVDYGFKLNNNGSFFSNPANSGNLNDTKLNTSNRGDDAWEAQAFFLKDGKYAVRACNSAPAASGWAWVAGAYWTAIGDAAGYQWEPNYCWELELDETKMTLTQQTQAYNTLLSFPFVVQTLMGYIKDASKFYSNAKQGNEGSYEALLDGTYSTYFHSNWSGGPSADHYLQAHLDAPVQTFQFYFKKRHNNDVNRPTTIIISASNDGENFTEIQTISSGMPTAEPVLDYLSPLIDMGAPYEYVRFTVTDTNSGNTCNGHVFFTFSEFYILPDQTENEAYWNHYFYMASSPATSLTNEDIAKINTIFGSVYVNATYQVKFNDKIVISRTVPTIGNTVPVMPNSFKKDFVTLSDPDVTLINTANNVVTYTATWDKSIFKISEDEENPQWQNMAMRGNWYVTTDSIRDGAYATVYKNALGLGKDAFQWAFVGNPWEGFKVLNKAEEGKSFGIMADQRTNQGIPTFLSETQGTHVWNIGKSTSGVGKFFLNVPSTTLYINQFGGAGGTVRFWNSGNNVGDGGSSFTVFDIPTDFSPFVADEISPYFESTAKYFVFTDAAKAEIGYDPAFKTACTYDEYKNMREKLTDEFLGNLANYVRPQDGYYFLKNKWYSTYMGIDPSDANMYGNYAAANQPKHVVKLTQAGDEGGYTISLMGKYAPATVVQSQPVTASTEAATYTLVIPQVGYAAFQADPESAYSVLHCRAEGEIVGWVANADASMWEAIDATSIPFTIDESGYATAYMPFPFEAGEVIPEALPTPVGSWAFDDPENPLASTGTATLTPAIHGTNGDPNEGTKWLETKESLEEANISLLEEGGLYVPKGSSLLMNTNNGATGFDKYTVMFDIKKDDMSGYTPLWQNSMADDKDGSLFIKNGQMGLGGSLGYNGNFSAGQWYRVVLVIDTPNKAALYVDGQLLSSCEHTDSYNKHWLLNGPGAVFFADEDGEEHDIKVRGLRFWDVPFTEDQVARLGTIEGEGSLTSTVPEAFGNWTFEGGTVSGTGTATMTASTGVVANEDGSITVDESNRLEMTTNAADNMNTYTLMMDVKFPDVARYTALIQTDLNNADDAGLFVHNGQIGINAAGLYYHGTLVNDTWYRIVFVVDDLYGSVYVDGVRVSKSSAQLEKWGISTGLFLFEDEDDDNDEGIATVMNIRFWNEALNPAQIAALATVGTEPNLKAFTGKIHDEWITLNEVSGTVPAREGVILKAAPGTYYLNIINDDIADYGDSFDENDLKGTLEPIPAAGKFILAQPEGKEIGFYKATTGNIAATKAYLQIENTSDIKGYIFKYNDDATAIKDINDFNDVRIIKQNDAIYNLAGQRLQKVQKGINIINGKKVLY